MADVTGTSGSETLRGTSRDDRIFGNGGDDIIYVSQGYDLIEGGDGIDTVALSYPDDFLFNHPTSTSVIFTLTNTRLYDSTNLINTQFYSVDRINISLISNNLNYSIDARSLDYTMRSISLFTGTGDDTVYGSPQDDYIDVGLGVNWVDAGRGTDTVQVEMDYRSGAIALTQSGSSVTVQQVGSVRSTISNAENIAVYQHDFGTTAGTQIDASAMTTAVDLEATSGSDMLVGGSGNDRLALRSGTTDTDVLTGGDGADDFVAYSFTAIGLGTRITDFAAQDQINFASVRTNESVTPAFIGTAAFSGVAGQYRYYQASAQTIVEVDRDGNSAADGRITITNGGFMLKESAPGSNILGFGTRGTANGDTLTGTSGNDMIYGLGGSDTIYGSSGTDTVDGGAGTDQLRFYFDTSNRSAGLSKTSGNRNISIGENSISDSAGQVSTQITGVEQVLLFTSSSSLDGFSTGTTTIDASAFAGNSGVQIISRLGTGNMVLTGSVQNDYIVIGQGSHTIDSGAGVDILQVGFNGSIAVTESMGVLRFVNGSNVSTARNAETLQIGAISGAGSIDASGLARAVTFNASYDQVIVGGSGNDLFENNYRGGSLQVSPSRFTGGAGADRYRYTGFGDNFMDVITDFGNDDTIDLSPVASFGTAIRFIGSEQDFTGEVNEVRARVVEGKTLIEVDTDGDGYSNDALTIENGAFIIHESLPGELRRAGLVLQGTAGNDQLTGGGTEHELLNGLAGNDRLNGGAGRDILYGGVGDDVLEGGAGRDFLYGGAGNDRLSDSGDLRGDGPDWETSVLDGGDGSDIIAASNGKYWLSGGLSNGFGDDGDDQLTLTNGVTGSQINGGDGNDIVYAMGTGDVYIAGEDGQDQVTVEGFTGGHVYGGNGRDVIRVPAGRFYVDGDSGADRIILTTVLTGSSDMRFIAFAAGEAGDQLDLSIYGANPFAAGGPLRLTETAGDTIITDVASGGRVVLQNVAARNLSTFNIGTTTGIFAPRDETIDDAFASDPTLEFPGLLIGADGNDRISGYGGDDQLFGGAGNDQVDGGLGFDFLFGGSGADSLAGGDGDDLLVAGTPAGYEADLIGYTELEHDVLVGGAGDDVLVAGLGDDADGGAGLDGLWLSLRGATAGVTLDTASIVGGQTRTINGGVIKNVEAVVLIAGTDFADMFDIATQSVTASVSGGAGNDRVVAHGSGVVFNGGTGDDVFVAGTGSDIFIGGEGRDTATIAGPFRRAALTSTDGAQTLRNGAATDTISGVEDIRFADGHYVADTNSVGAQLQRLFDTVLHRAPDQGGLEYWLDAINDRGLTLTQVAGSFLASGEFRSGGASVASNGAFIDYVFATALGREADAGGRSYWVGQLDAGLSRTDALVSISESGEHRALTAGLTAQGYFETDDDYQYVALLFDAILGRTPDTGGLLYWGEQIKTGARSRGQVADAITGSAEFQGHVQGASNAALVDYAFNTALDRAPDAGGRAYWIDQLDHGVSVSSMMQSFATGPEHEQTYFGHIIGGIDVM